MKTRGWLAALAVVWVMLFSRVASAADEGAATPTTQVHKPRFRFVDPTARPKIVYRGRALSYASFALLGTGAAMTPFGALSVYDYHGDPFDKWKYDRVFEQRRPAGLPMLITGFTLIGAHLPTLMVGVLVEGHGLHKVTGLSVVPGWVGFSLIFTGAALIPVGIAAWPVLIVGSAVGLAGYVCVLTQFALNVRASRRDLSPEVHDELYHTRRAPSFGAAPMLLKGGGGATFVMSW
jgi:hypothetical protein